MAAAHLRGVGSGGVGAGDVLFEGLDGLFLAGDDPLDQVADGDDAEDAVALEHGEMAEVVLGHQAHALVHGLVGGDELDRGGHDLADVGFAGVVAEEDALAGVVALGEDADELAGVEHEKCADVVAGHLLEGLVDRPIGRDGENFARVFVLENRSDGIRDLHGTLPWSNSAVPSLVVG